MTEKWWWAAGSGDVMNERLFLREPDYIREQVRKNPDRQVLVDLPELMVSVSVTTDRTHAEWLIYWKEKK